jgi:hypothetical protein
MRIIQVLGYSLNKNNTVSPILEQRLLSAKNLVEENTKETNYLIIVSGGNPPNEPEKNQAKKMKQWLVKRNIPRKKIIEEGESLNTVEQLLYLHDYCKANQGVNEVIIIGTEGGFKERIELLSKFTIPENIKIAVIGASLPQEISPEEKEQFTMGEQSRLKSLKTQLKKLNPNINKLELLQEIAEKYRQGDWTYFERIGYNLSSGKLRES